MRKRRLRHTHIHQKNHVRSRVGICGPVAMFEFPRGKKKRQGKGCIVPTIAVARTEIAWFEKERFETTSRISNNNRCVEYTITMMKPRVQKLK